MNCKQAAGFGVAALLAVALSTPAFAEDGKYVQNSAGEAVKNSAGECVLAVFGSSPEGCEAVPAPAKPVPPAVKKPLPAPVKPKPVPVVPKVKVKGNYKGPVAIDPTSRAVLQSYQK